VQVEVLNTGVIALPARPSAGGGGPMRVDVPARDPSFCGVHPADAGTPVVTTPTATARGDLLMAEPPVGADGPEKDPPKEGPEPAAPSPPHVADVPLPKAPPHLHDRIRAVLRRHEAMWSVQAMGVIKATRHHIEITPGAKPVRVPPRRAGPKAREAEAAEVERQLAADVIESTSFEWGFHVVLVPKKDSTLRFCVDYRLLNAVSKRDSYPLPRLDECIDSLGEAKVFSTLDCNAGYWQVLIADGDREKTAFVCHKGAYHYKWMPFGLTNAPATFQRALDIILSGVKWQSCLVYLNDVIVYSKTPEAHVQHLDEVLGLLRAAGVTLKLPKCRVSRTTVEYLGHEITHGRLGVLQAHTKALREAAFPTTRTQVRSIIGMCNVFRRFVPNFPRIATPLTDLMGSTAPVSVPPPTAEQLFAFEELKCRLTQPPVLALPRAGHKYVLDVDAYGTQVGAALLQEQQEGGLRPVAFISCVLEGAERAFGVTEMENLAVVWASLKLRAYLDGDRFLVRTDHDCLRWLLNIDGTAHRRLARWHMRLNELSFDIAYKPGQTHWLADGMSRIVTSGANRSADDTDLPVFAVIRAETARGLETANNVSGPTTRAIDKGEVATAQGEDPLCRKVVEALNAGRAMPFFEDSDGLVCRRATHGGVAQIVVPESPWERVLRLEHETRGFWIRLFWPESG